MISFFTVYYLLYVVIPARLLYAFPVLMVVSRRRVFEGIKKKKRLVVDGEQITAVRKVSPGYVVNITDHISGDEYTEREFLQTLAAWYQRDVHFEIDWRGSTRIYHPRLQGWCGKLAMGSKGDQPNPVKRAFIVIPLLFNRRIYVTDRLNRCAGPCGDFFTGVGGYITPVDVIATIRLCHWNSLYIEWNDGSNVVTRFDKNDVLTTPGKLYPRVTPFASLGNVSKKTFWSRLKNLTM
jgi:hypothetical protein